MNDGPSGRGIAVSSTHAAIDEIIGRPIVIVAGEVDDDAALPLHTVDEYAITAGKLHDNKGARQAKFEVNDSL